MTAPFVYDGAMNRNVSLSYVEQRATTIAALWYGAAIRGSSAYLVQGPGFTGGANESIESESQSTPVIRPCSMPSVRWSRPSFRLSKFSHRPTRWCL
ncbi:hypothetical protein, partial [Mesorhizobium ciceri]|uniref:hypothetical protein n=1 Tax=Mesorhizobium ciceri TaxID=39645 RepID=UPI00047937B8